VEGLLERFCAKLKPMTFVQILRCPPFVACAMRTNSRGRGLRAQRALHEKCTNVVWSDLVKPQAFPSLLKADS
jgi:hypothetical protein